MGRDPGNKRIYKTMGDLHAALGREGEAVGS
jgi:hypothetical protein